MATRPRAEYDIHANDKSDAGWRSTISRADASARKLKSVIGGAFAGIVGIQTFTSQISKAIQFGDEIGKLSVKIGANVEVTQELVAVARQFDVEIGSVTTSFRKMQTAISQASTGGKKQVEAFRALGLDIEKIRRLRPEEQFILIGDAISRLREEEDRARAETVLFGLAGGELRPLFENGAAGIHKAREEVKGFIKDASEIEKLQAADDAIKKLTATWDSLWQSVAIGVVSYAESIVTAMEKTKEFATQQGRVASGVRITLGSVPLVGQLFTAAELRAQAEAQAEANNFSRGGGPRRGRARGGAGTPPGFAPGGGATAGTDAFTREMRDGIRAAEQWVVTINAADSSTRKFLEGSMSDFPEVFDDLPEPILELSESLIQADELQKEFTRSMFQNFSDLFMSIGDGADNFVDSMLGAFKRLLADRATLEFFNLLSGLGGELTSSSSGKGFWGAVGSFLTSTFGGGKAGGGPLQQGKWYMSGEKGPEPIWGGGPGAFAMGYGGGSGTVVNINTSIDARGATQDAIKALPEVLKRNNDALEARIVQRLRSGKYG